MSVVRPPAAVENTLNGKRLAFPYSLYMNQSKHGDNVRDSRVLFVLAARQRERLVNPKRTVFVGRFRDTGVSQSTSRTSFEGTVR
jgi:hypothetical protein